MQLLRSILTLLSLLCLISCSRTDSAPAPAGKLPVVATIFPVYDFVRSIGGDRVAVTLLLPPGVEAHHFEPKPADMARVAQAKLFVFTNPAMEPWAAKLLSSVGGTVTAVNASTGIQLLAAGAGGHAGHQDDHDQQGSDPHVWLDLNLAQQMVTTIEQALSTADPGGAASYRTNAAAYRQQLAALDGRYRTGLATCGSRTLVMGGHAAFSYLAARYGLIAKSAMGVAANAEPTPQDLITLIKELKQLPQRTLFAEEMVAPRLADTLAREAGATVRRLHATHTVSKEDLARGVTFLDLMEKNLTELRGGLACQ
jgi:zinc transport system substrate-binding protein